MVLLRKTWRYRKFPEEKPEVHVLAFRLRARSRSSPKVFGSITRSSWRKRQEIIGIQIKNHKNIEDVRSSVRSHQRSSVCVDGIPWKSARSKPEVSWKFDSLCAQRTNSSRTNSGSILPPMVGVENRFLSSSIEFDAICKHLSSRFRCHYLCTFYKYIYIYINI